jgi:hypothetical protein
MNKCELPDSLLRKQGLFGLLGRTAFAVCTVADLSGGNRQSIVLSTRRTLADGILQRPNNVRLQFVYISGCASRFCIRSQAESPPKEPYPSGKGGLSHLIQQQ